MRVEAASREHVRFVAENMRDRDFEEFSAVTEVSSRSELANYMADAYGGRPDVVCGLLDETPVCIGGSIAMRPNVVTLLFFATPDFAKIAYPATRFIKKELFPRLVEAGTHRIEAVSLATYTDVHKWLHVLGLRQETGPLKNYGKNGEAFVQFAWCKDVCSVGA